MAAQFDLNWCDVVGQKATCGRRAVAHVAHEFTIRHLSHDFVLSLNGRKALHYPWITQKCHMCARMCGDVVVHKSYGVDYDAMFYAFETEKKTETRGLAPSFEQPSKTI